MVDISKFNATATSIEKVMYKSGYRFHMEHSENPTLESAHIAGLKAASRLDVLRKEHSGPTKHIDLSTGETHYGNY